jgi:hypothetical protein
MRGKWVRAGCPAPLLRALLSQGVLSTTKGNERVVLKRVKAKVEVRRGRFAGGGALGACGGSRGGRPGVRAACRSRRAPPAASRPATDVERMRRCPAAQGAAELQEMELLLNAYASKARRGMGQRAGVGPGPGPRTRRMRRFSFRPVRGCSRPGLAHNDPQDPPAGGGPVPSRARSSGGYNRVNGTMW